MSAFIDISTILDTHTNLLGLPTAWANSNFKPTLGELYLRPTQLSAATEVLGYNEASDKHGGTYQIDVIAPIGKGKGEALAQAEAIANHFKRDTRLTEGSTIVLITNTSALPSVTSSTFFMISVEIEYNSFVTPR